MIRPLVPDVPDPLKIPDYLQKKIDGWIAYFQNMSPRIKIVRSVEPNFQALKIENYMKKELGYSPYPQDVIIKSWPTISEIAFAVTYNTAMPGHPDEYLAQNATLFCYGNFAFDLNVHAFEQIGLNHDDKMVFEFATVDLGLHKWKFKASLIAQDIQELQESIPPPPEI